MTNLLCCQRCRHFGGRRNFWGQVSTIKCLNSNHLVRQPGQAMAIGQWHLSCLPLHGRRQPLLILVSATGLYRCF